jgi:hypothetical protein
MQEGNGGQRGRHTPLTAMECNLPGMGELSCAERSGATFTGMCCDNLSASHTLGTH